MSTDQEVSALIIFPNPGVNPSADTLSVVNACLFACSTEWTHGGRMTHLNTFVIQEPRRWGGGTQQPADVKVHVCHDIPYKSCTHAICATSLYHLAAMLAGVVTSPCTEATMREHQAADHMFATVHSGGHSCAELM